MRGRTSIEEKITLTPAPDPSPIEGEGRGKWVDLTGALAEALGGATWLLAIILCVCLAQVGHGQREDSPGGVESVFLDTDAAAAKKLGAARDLLAAKQWGDGIDLVRQITEQHGDRMVAIGPRRYVSVATYCDILLSSLPEEGLKLYRLRTDAQARRWFDGARVGHDEQGLQRILQRAFLSSYGDDALLLLGQFAWERGNLPQARSYWEQLLPLEQTPEPGQLPPVLRYPSGTVDAVQIRARLVLCSLMQGQLQRGQRELAEFRRLHPQAQGVIAGQSGNLAEILESQAAHANRESFSQNEVEVRTFAGNARRNQVQSQTVDVGSVQWSIPVPPMRVELPVRIGEFARLQIFDRHERGPGALTQDVLCYYPLVYNNLVLHCDETAVYARDLLSSDGGPAWGTDGAIYKLPADMIGTPPPAIRRVGLPQFTMSVGGGRLFAHLVSGAAGNRNRLGSASAGLLVCLNLERQGDLIWTVKPDELRDDGGPWAFDGAPLADGGRVYIALRRREPQLQLNVACFDATRGKLLWNRKVCLGIEQFGPETAEFHHQLLTVADDRLYYGTNQGAIAALHVDDGTPQWVTTYPRADVETASAFNKRQERGPSPCVYHDGQVFVAPTDSDHVLAYDAETGLLKWHRALQRNGTQLVGVEDGKLIAAGDLLWALDTEDGHTAWIAGRAAPEAATRGRCAIGGGVVYWPRREELLLVDTATGRIRREIDWEEQHGLNGGGNITLADGFLLLGQADRIVAFSEFGSLRKRHEDRIARSPHDPWPRFELALLAEAAHDTDLARDAYSQVRDLSTPSDLRDGQPLVELASRRLSQLLLRLGARSLAAKEATEAIARLTEAAEVATTPDAQVAARRALARAHDELGDSAASVAAWQQLLDLSSAGRERDDADFLSGAGLARNEIDRLIAAHGRSVYAAIDETARQELTEALLGRDANATAALLRRYPNARAADNAALQLATMLRATGRSHRADRTYKERLTATADVATRAAMLAGLAQNAESRRGWRSAQRWWEQLYDNHSAETVDVDGMSRTVHEFVPERLERIRRLTELHDENRAFAPLLRKWERMLRAGDIVLVPEGRPPSDEHDCALVVGATVRCLNVSDGNVRWEAVLPELPIWSRFVADVLVLGTSSAATGVAPEDGSILWQRSFAPDAIEGAHASFRVAGDRLCCLSSASGVWSLFPETGEVAWRYRPARGVLQVHWLCSPELVVVQRLAPDRWEALSGLDGALVAEGDGPSRPWPEDPVRLDADRLLASVDDQAIPQVLDVKQGRFEPFGTIPFSMASAVPNRSNDAAALVAAVDSERLARFDTDNGSKLWSCRAGVEALLSPRDAACRDSERVYVATSGVLRCYALDDGRLLWEQYVGPRGDWRVERGGRWIVAYRLSAADRATIILCDPVSGELAQRLHSDGPTRSVRCHSEAGRALVVTDTRLIGFGSSGSSGD